MANNKLNALGIDFGTCSTSAAVLIGNDLHQVNLSQSQFSESLDMPTAVFVESDGHPLIGYQAVRARLRDPSRFFQQFKLEIERTPGRMLPVNGQNRMMSWTEVVSAVLRHVKTIAEKDFNQSIPFTQVTLTVPGLYAKDGTGWKIMDGAARTAGFGEIKIIREPHAAALYFDYLSRENNIPVVADGELILIYDLGGGTFDPALIRRSKDQYPVERAQGTGVRCGGIFFDEALRKEFSRQCPESVAALVPPSRNADGTIAATETIRARTYAREVSDLEKFLLECKHGFSQPETESFHEISPIDPSNQFSISRANFDSLLTPLLDATIRCCEGLMNIGGVQWKDLSQVILVGGSCSLPVVRNRIAEAMKRNGGDPSRICWQIVPGTGKLFDPRLAVSRGACLSGLRPSTAPKPGDREASPFNDEQSNPRVSESARAAVVATPPPQAAIPIRTDYTIRDDPFEVFRERANRPKEKGK